MPVKKQYLDYSLTPSTRSKIADLLKAGAICLELGVGNGWYSEALLKKQNVKKVYSIDNWKSPKARKKKKQALNRFKPFGDKSQVIHSSFSDSVNQFKDNYFDFIHLDGFPKFGYEQELNDWFPKLKKGGIFSIHDYYPKFPMNIKAIKDFCKEHNYNEESVCGFDDKLWTWWVIKKVNK